MSECMLAARPILIAQNKKEGKRPDPKPKFGHTIADRHPSEHDDRTGTEKRALPRLGTWLITSRMRRRRTRSQSSPSQDYVADKPAVDEGAVRHAILEDFWVVRLGHLLDVGVGEGLGERLHLEQLGLVGGAGAEKLLVRFEADARHQLVQVVPLAPFWTQHPSKVHQSARNIEQRGMGHTVRHGDGTVF